MTSGLEMEQAYSQRKR